MDTPNTRVWVQFDEGRPTKVFVNNDDDVDDVITAALKMENITTIRPSLVSAHFNNELLKPGLKVCDMKSKGCGCDDENVLLIKLPKGGMCSMMFL